MAKESMKHFELSLSQKQDQEYHLAENWVSASIDVY